MNQYKISVEAIRPGFFSNTVIKGVDIIAAETAKDAILKWKEENKYEIKKCEWLGSPIRITDIQKI